MLTLQNLRYKHLNGDLLFDNINLSVNKQDKIALIGNNGIGKSTLLNILSGNLLPEEGAITVASQPYYIPQLFGQFNDFTIAQALRVEDKLQALSEILGGNVTEANMTILDDDWGIEERCSEALAHWGLDGFDLTQKMATLSGGQKTKVFLAGIAIHQPEIVLLDEPSNHLDAQSREILYQYIRSTTNTLIVVSHDRTLLNLVSTICELTKHGINTYGGNYNFYLELKAIETAAFNEDLKSKEKALRKAKEMERDTIERQQKLDARGKKKQEKAGVPKVMMNLLRNNAEKSTAHIKDIHAEKVGGLSQELNELRKALPDKDKMKIGFYDATLHKGKILFTAKSINHSYGEHLLWPQPLNIQIISGARISIKGVNGSGKTTLIKIILGELQPSSGTIIRADNIRSIYIDQDYSLIDNTRNVYEQAQLYNTENLQEHEVKSRLTHFLFTKSDWDKPCAAISGGEKMRLILCCLTLQNLSPDIIILDEPTNNLDIQNIEILTNAINEYNGTLITISHDAWFLEQINANDILELHTTT